MKDTQGRGVDVVLNSLAGRYDMMRGPVMRYTVTYFIASPVGRYRRDRAFHLSAYCTVRRYRTIRTESYVNSTNHTKAYITR